MSQPSQPPEKSSARLYPPDVSICWHAASRLTAPCDVLCQPGERMRHVYSPRQLHLSDHSIDGRAGLEVGLVGDEGMLGISLMLGVSDCTVALWSGCGPAWRMEAATFCRELKQAGAATRSEPLPLYNLSQLDRRRLHSFHLGGDAACPWLLMTRDRAHADEFRYARIPRYMLGVRRAGVTRAASSLAGAS